MADQSVLELRQVILLCNNCRGHMTINKPEDRHFRTGEQLFWLGDDITPECDGCESRDYSVVWAK